MPSKQLWKQATPRVDAKEWRELWDEWWAQQHATAGAYTVEMGKLSFKVDKHQRDFKTPGSIYVSIDERMAVLYVPGSNWTNIDDVENRLRQCPMLAAGSIAQLQTPSHRCRQSRGY